jgi:hypothetical protein
MKTSFLGYSHKYTVLFRNLIDCYKHIFNYNIAGENDY